MLPRRTLLAAVGAALVLGLAPGAHAAKRTTVVKIIGRITAVDVNSIPNTVTITSNTASATLKITPNTTIKYTGQPGTLTHLRVGRDAKARYERSTAKAVLIDVAEDTNLRIASGTVLAADATTGQVTLDTNQDGTPDLSIIADARTELTLGTGTLALSQLAAVSGCSARVSYDKESFQAFGVRAEPTNVQVIFGTVTAIDQQALTLGVRTQEGELAMGVAAGASVHLLDEEATINDVLVDDRVRLVYTETAAGEKLALDLTLTAVESKTVRGTLTGVTSTTLTIRTAGGDTVTLTVNEKTTITLNGRPAGTPKLTAALTRSSRVKVSATYYERGTAKLATEVSATARTR